MGSHREYFICSVSSNYADDILISNNIINQNSASNLNYSTGIWINYGNNILINKNEINETGIGINVDNAGTYISENTIHLSGQYNGSTGIILFAGYSPVLQKNNIYNYSTGIYLNYSSPLMLSNVITNPDLHVDAAFFSDYSYPRLRPQDGIGYTIWDWSLPQKVDTQLRVVN